MNDIVFIGISILLFIACLNISYCIYETSIEERIKKKVSKEELGPLRAKDIAVFIISILIMIGCIVFWLFR